MIVAGLRPADLRYTAMQFRQRSELVEARGHDRQRHAGGAEAVLGLLQAAQQGACVGLLDGHDARVRMVRRPRGVSGTNYGPASLMIR